MLARVGMFTRTALRMRPSMAIARLRGTQRVSERTFAGERTFKLPRIAIASIDLDSDYLSRFDADALFEGEFLLLNERHQVDTSIWKAPEASHLWNFNLHYFEWGIVLAARWKETGESRWVEGFKNLVLSWVSACSYPKGDAWHPYTISLRLTNWLICIDLFDGLLEHDGGFFSTMHESMYRQYRHLLANQEAHLRANHWWENLKTLAIMSAAFGEHSAHTKVMRRLEGQLEEQILPDGVHFERSLMYHKLVLEGMLRIWVASERVGFLLPGCFAPKVKLMLDAMASLERGMGKTPFFNDSADGVAKECGALVAACKLLLDMEADNSKTTFPNAGYYKLYDGDIAVMFDVGEPGPSYMLGHAHCDCLSFELSYKGKPVIVNSGTYAYQSKLRPYFRSTAAHNTCMTNGEEQLECWGEHRIGRGYRDPMIEEISDKHLIGAMTLPSGKRLQRSIVLSGGSRVFVEDFVDRAEGAKIESFVHVAPRSSVILEAAKGSLKETESDYSPEFGLLETSRTFSIEAVGRASYSLRIAGEKGGARCEG